MNRIILKKNYFKTIKKHNILNGLSGSDYTVANIPYLYITLISCKV